MQELSNSIKRPNLRIMDIEEIEKLQAKGLHYTVNKLITENLPNLETSPGHNTDLTKIELLHGILSLKQQAQRTEKEF
jgi:hypothetical protein